MQNTDVVKSGNFVTSHYEVFSELPDSFTEILAAKDEAWKYGISAEIHPDQLLPSKEVSRFFLSVGARTENIWTPANHPAGSKEAAIGEVIELVTERYRQSDLMLENPQFTHQLMGEVARNYLSAGDDQNAEGPYSDTVHHVDFVPDNMLCWALFASDVSPTGGQSGEFQYRGNLHVDYRDTDILQGYRHGEGGQWPANKPGEIGKIMYSNDARTLLHHRIHTEGWRTFMRLFVGPVFSP